jgi:glycerol kinase
MAKAALESVIPDARSARKRCRLTGSKTGVQSTLRVDGGNVCQQLGDAVLSDYRRTRDRPVIQETTALGGVARGMRRTCLIRMSLLYLGSAKPNLHLR